MGKKLLLSDGTQIDPTEIDSSPFDPSIAGFTKVLKQLEGGDYQNRTGDAGSSAGAYQWNHQPNGKSITLQAGELPSRWKNMAGQFLKDPNAPMTKENQDFVAYQQIKAYKDAGRTPEEIDALWNGAKKDETTGKYVHISADRKTKYEKAVAALRGGISNTNVQSANVIGGYDLSGYDTGENNNTTKEMTTVTPDENLKAGANPTTAEKITNTLGTVAGVKNIGQSAGYSLYSATGGAKDVKKQTQDLINQQTLILDKIKEAKAQGKDTSSLMKALQYNREDLAKLGANTDNLLTGGKTKGGILLDAAQLALMAIAPNLKGLLKGGTALNSPYLTKALAYSPEAFSKADAIRKVEMLEKSLKYAKGNSTMTTILKKAIEELQPAVNKLLKISTKTPGVKGGLLKQALLTTGLVGAGSLVMNKGKQMLQKATGFEGGVSGTVKKVLGQ